MYIIIIIIIFIIIKNLLSFVMQQKDWELRGRMIVTVWDILVR